jgi:hypothetical protein
MQPAYRLQIQMLRVPDAGKRPFVLEPSRPTLQQNVHLSFHLISYGLAVSHSPACDKVAQISKPLTILISSIVYCWNCFPQHTVLKRRCQINGQSPLPSCPAPDCPVGISSRYSGSSVMIKHWSPPLGEDDSFLMSEERHDNKTVHCDHGEVFVKMPYTPRDTH